jgi:hypothetical protein
MRRSWFWICVISTVLVACSTQDENYYRLNPQALQQAIKGCPNKQTGGINCEQLIAVASSVNKLAYQLQINPQEFGKQILFLQQNLAKQRSALHINSDQPELRKIVAESQQQLVERLAIVKWLESPES